MGRILDGRQKLTKDRKSVTTFYLVRVQEVLKGELRNGDRIVIAVPGGAGRIAGRTVRFRRIDARRIQTGQSHVLFLHRPTTKKPGYELTGGTQGLWCLRIPDHPDRRFRPNVISDSGIPITDSGDSDR